MDPLIDVAFLRLNISMLTTNNTENDQGLLLSEPYQLGQFIKLTVIVTGFFSSVLSAVVFRRPLLYKNVGAAYLLYVICISDSCYLFSAFTLSLERLQCGFVLYNGICQTVLYASYVLRCFSTWLMVSLSLFSCFYCCRPRGRTAHKHFRSLRCKVIVAWLGLFAGMSFLHITWMSGVDKGICLPLFGLYFAAWVVMEKVETFTVVIIPDLMMSVVCVIIIYICLRRYYLKRAPTEEAYIACDLDRCASHAQGGDISQDAVSHRVQCAVNREDATFYLKIPFVITCLYVLLSLPQHAIQTKILALQLIHGDAGYSVSPEENYRHEVFHLLSLTRFTFNCVAYALLSSSFRANFRVLVLPSSCTTQGNNAGTTDIESLSVAEESEAGTTLMVPNADSKKAQSALEI